MPPLIAELRSMANCVMLLHPSYVYFTWSVTLPLPTAGSHVIRTVVIENALSLRVASALWTPSRIETDKRVPTDDTACCSRAQYPLCQFVQTYYSSICT